jgi:hypothetical protein
MMRSIAAATLLLGLGGAAPCWASSYVVADGVNRAAAVALHCVGANSVAVPCGTVAQPVVVSPIAGGATAANQASEISAQQSAALSLGSQSDPSYTGGNGSIISLLKGFLTAVSGGTQALPFGGVPISRSASVSAGQSTQLFPVNSARHYLAFQVPASSSIWVNFLGGPAGANGTDCILLPAGTTYESGQYVIRGSITVYAPVALTISAWEG